MDLYSNTMAGRMSNKSENTTSFTHPRRFRRPHPNFGSVRILNSNNYTEPSSDYRINPDSQVATYCAPPRLELGVVKNKNDVVQLSDGSWSRPLLDKSILWKIYEMAPPSDKFNFVNNKLQSHGLHTIPDYANGRILIDEKTTDRNSGYTQFIGSILNVTDSEMKIISTMQPVTMVTNRILPSIAENWRHFDLICAEDGATIGLYWFNNAWVIRTINSFDASNIIWNGRATFGQMIDDVMRKYPQFRYDALDKTKSYTFGIKHPAIHAYHEMQDHPVMRAWFIQCTDIAKINNQCGIFNGTASFDESIGLENQLLMTNKVIAGMSNITMSRDPKYNNNFLASVDTGIGLSGLSLGNVLDTTRGALGSVVSGVSNSAARYFGVILRSKKAAYFIPSDLYEYITTTCYTREISNLLGDEKFNRYKFIILFNALCPDNERDIFMCLYPAWATPITHIREFLSKSFAGIMFDVYDHLINGTKLPNVSENTLILARSFVINWARRYGTPTKNERARITGMYANYVMQKHNARALYNVVNDEIGINIDDYKRD